MPSFEPLELYDLTSSILGSEKTEDIDSRSVTEVTHQWSWSMLESLTT